MLANYDQVLVVICCLHLNLFTNFVQEVEERHAIGWSFIVFLNLHLWTSLLCVVPELLRSYRLLTLKFLITLMVWFDWKWLLWIIQPCEMLRRFRNLRNMRKMS